MLPPSWFDWLPILAAAVVVWALSPRRRRRA